MKARFESKEDLPLSKILNIPVCIIIVKSLYVLIMSRTRFRVNPHSIVA